MDIIDTVDKTLEGLRAENRRLHGELEIARQSAQHHREEGKQLREELLGTAMARDKEVSELEEEVRHLIHILGDRMVFYKEQDFRERFCVCIEVDTLLEVRNRAARLGFREEVMRRLLDEAARHLTGNGEEYLFDEETLERSLERVPATQLITCGQCRTNWVVPPLQEGDPPEVPIPPRITSGERPSHVVLDAEDRRLLKKYLWGESGAGVRELADALKEIKEMRDKRSRSEDDEEKEEGV